MIIFASFFGYDHCSLLKNIRSKAQWKSISPWYFSSKVDHCGMRFTQKMNKLLFDWFLYCRYLCVHSAYYIYYVQLIIIIPYKQLNDYKRHIALNHSFSILLLTYDLTIPLEFCRKWNEKENIYSADMKIHPVWQWNNDLISDCDGMNSTIQCTGKYILIV